MHEETSLSEERHTFCRSRHGNGARKSKSNEGCKGEDGELHDCGVQGTKINWPKRSVLVRSRPATS